MASYEYVQSTVHNVKYTTHEQSLETMIEGLFDRATQAEAMLVINRSTDPSLPISMGTTKTPDPILAVLARQIGGSSTTNAPRPLSLLMARWFCVYRHDDRSPQPHVTLTGVTATRHVTSK